MEVIIAGEYIAQTKAKAIKKDSTSTNSPICRSFLMIAIMPMIKLSFRISQMAFAWVIDSIKAV